jgi:Trypsin-like peptidase domain
VTAAGWRVAQIVVFSGSSHEGSRGSGYLLGSGLVLTAAHVVAGASAVRVRLDVDQQTEIDVQAETWWADPQADSRTDLAVIMLPANATIGRDVERVRFGRISDCTAVLAVQAFGFPRFKLRDSSVVKGDQGIFRDLEQVTGHVPVAANRRQGTLAVYLDDPPPASPQPAGCSPWEGMSGAAVWAADRIIGVVAEHHLDEGAGRLTARRIDRAYEQLPEADLDQLISWLKLAPAVAQMVDVVPPEPGEILRSAYLEQVRDIAPDALIGRDSELTQWAEFCAGTEAYAWWQAGPWAGKSALASWFVTHPPAGADIVSFFITGRLYGQADSDAFLDAMIEQLGALSPGGGQAASAAGARVGTWLNLLASVAAQAEERGRRLVVVVDGLDEDDAGALPPRGRPSIASLLPRRPPRGARFIITSRPDPGLPDDVPAGHPLRACIPCQLQVSWVAEDLERRAKLELQDLLVGDQVAIDVVGCIAGSGGGLTMSDLSALTGAAPHKLDPVLRGVFGRSLHTRVSAYPRDAGADPATRVYLFAHETLRVTAEEQLGTELTGYRQRIHNWIGSYASQGWPDTTPSYSVRGYPGLLTATSDGARLSALARDPRRHAYLLRVTGSEYATLTEIGGALRLVAAQDVPDLQALVELAIYRHAISIRGQSIPVSLPAAWARLARFDHAEALARAITKPGARAQALAELATAAAQTRNSELAARLATDAEDLARTITNPHIQARPLTVLATAAAQAGNQDRAETLARSITDPRYRAPELAELAAVAAQTGNSELAARLATDAEDLARTITATYFQARALAELAAAAAQAGDSNRSARLATDAEDKARTLTNPDVQTQALAGLAAAAARAGDSDRAARLAADAEDRTGAVTNPSTQAEALTDLATVAAQAGNQDHAENLARTIDPEYQAQALADLATVAAQAGNQDHAENLARTITEPEVQSQALAMLAIAAAQAGNADRAAGLAADAEDLTHTINPFDQARALTELATATAQAGDADRAAQLAAGAEDVARTISSPYLQAMALAEVATAAALAGNQDHAENLARTITDPGVQAQALAELATAAAQAGNQDHADNLARTITDPGAQVEALAKLATAAAQAGNADRAAQLAADAEDLARTITNPFIQARMLAELATTAAQAGGPDHAENLARTITDTDVQARALAKLATAAAQAGDLGRAARLAADAEDLARALEDPNAQAQALAELAVAAALAGDRDRADTLARTITNPYSHVRALTRLATVAAQAGDPDRAAQLAAGAEDLARALAHPNDQARALSLLATEAAQAAHHDRARHLLTLSISGEDPEIRWWIETVARFYPSIIREAGKMFLSAYKMDR